MQTLDISQINILAPYPVWYEGKEIQFKTDYNILYSVAFELDDMLGLTAYWFRITNRSRKKNPWCKYSVFQYNKMSTCCGFVSISCVLGVHLLTSGHLKHIRLSKLWL